MIRHQIHIVTPVWGEEFTKTFLDFGLQSLLTEDNLGAFIKSSSFQGVYKIYTHSKDAKIIKESLIYKKLSSLIKVEFHLIEEIEKKLDKSQKSKYQKLAICWENSLQEAFKDDAALIFLHPDIICSNNLIYELLSFLKQGYRAVCLQAIRLAKQDFTAYLKNNFQEYDFSPRKLVTIAMNFLHPFSKKLFIDEEQLPQCPSSLYWRCGKNILTRTFHIHPLLIWPTIKVSTLTSVDGDLIEKACPSSQIKIIDNSDQLTVFEMTDQSPNILENQNTNNLLHLMRWSFQSVRPFHWQIIKHKMCFKQTDCDCSKSKVVKKSIYKIKYLRFLVAIYANARKNPLLLFFYKKIKKIVFQNRQS